MTPETLYSTNPIIAAKLAIFFPVDLKTKNGEKEYSVKANEKIIIVTVKK